MFYTPLYNSLSMDELTNMKENFWSELPQKNLGKDSPFETIYQFKGCWFALPFLQGAKQVLSHFKPLPTDVILASYPKTGTTWLKAILYSILNRPSLSSVSSALSSKSPHQLVPSLELNVFRPDFFSKANSPPSVTRTYSLETDTCTGKRRIFSTHVPYQIFTDHSIDSSDCKIVYITRNPKDTLISYWHFVKKLQMARAMTWQLEVAVDNFCSGSTLNGDYYDHILGYKKESDVRTDKFFFTTYEELTSDTKDVVKRMAGFLGCPFHKDEEDQVEEIVKNCSIDTLKTHEINKSNESLDWFPVPYNSFFRQGRVGDHKNYLTPEMIDRIDAITKEKFHGSGFMFAGFNYR